MMAKSEVQKERLKKGINSIAFFIVLLPAFIATLIFVVADSTYDKYNIAQEYLVVSQHQSANGMAQFNQCVVDHTNKLTTQEFVDTALKNIEENADVESPPAGVEVSFPCSKVSNIRGKVQTQLDVGSRTWAIASNLPYVLSHASLTLGE